MYSTSNKDSVVETARQRREERALLRKQETSAVVIQSTFRSFKSRTEVALRWRNEVDDVIGFVSIKPTKKASLSDFYRNSPNKKSSTNSVRGDKIKTSSASLPEAQWKFAAFGSNVLTGDYGNLARNTLSDSPTSPEKPETKELVEKKAEISTDNDLDDGVVAKKKIPARILATEIFKTVQKLLFVLDTKKDKERFVEVCKYLLKNLETENSSKYSYVANCINKAYVLLWLDQIKRLLLTVFKFIDQLKFKDHNDYHCLSIYLRTLIMFTDNSNWKALKKQVVLQSAFSQMCGKILSHLYLRGSMAILGGTLCRGTSAMQQGSLLAAFTLSIRLLVAMKINEESLNSFVSSILTVPALVWQLNHISPKSIQIFFDHGILPLIIKTYHAEENLKKCGIIPNASKTSKPVVDILCLAANLLQILVIERETLEKFSTQTVNLLIQLFKFLHGNTASKSSNSTWHPVLGYFPHSDYQYSSEMGYVKKQLELMWEPRFVRVIFHDVLSLKPLHGDSATPVQAEQISNKTKTKAKFADKMSSYLKKIASSRPQRVVLPTGGRKLEYLEVKNTCSACFFYKLALSVFTKQLRLEMLTGLAFVDEVLCRLWRFICEIGPSGGLSLFLSSLTQPFNVSEPYFAVFTLFCDMTSHILSILDDVEFYEQQIPFHLEELVTISAFLRQFVIKMIWGKIVNDSQSAMYPVFESSHTLLMMLYDRNARRSFTPQGHWLCREIKPSLVRSEVEKHQLRAEFLIDKIPFVIPHKDRVLLFRSFVDADKKRLGISAESDACHIRIHRSRLVNDGFFQLNSLHSEALKGVIRVKFVNDLGLDEAGIDQDGVFKEFLEEIIKKVFNPDMNLFKVTIGGESKLYPSPQSKLHEEHLTQFKFVGRMLGKAVYEGIVLDLPFANFFLRSLLGQHRSNLYSPIDELPSLDAEFYKNLTWIKRYEGDIADLGLTFTYEEDNLGKVESHELIEGGSVVPVTNENKIMYIHTMAHYRMHTQIKEQTKWFVAGFRSVVPHNWTDLFSAPELQRLISGDNVEMDLTDLKKHVIYYGGFHATHRVVRWLWDVLERDCTPAQRSAFLKFVTSCSRPPLLGFAYLQPQFSIRCVEVPDDEDTGDTVATVLRGFFRLNQSKSSQTHAPHRLPTASTCFNLLKLPNYPTKDVLKDKLKQAIANNTGFELS